MTRQLKSVDVVVVGLGWTGAIVAKELGDAGLSVVVLERGRDQGPLEWGNPWHHDELKYVARRQLSQDLSRDTITARNTMSETALPIRRHGGFILAEGVGGGGAHWNAAYWRYAPDEFRLRSRVIERYGAKFLPDNIAIQDWPVSYDDLEPHYDFFDKVVAASGKAGNLKGKLQAGGNPFEGPRQNEYPQPPMKLSLAGEMFDKAAGELGMHPFPQPAAIATEGFLNPYDQAQGPCVYCGHCSPFGCEVNARASPNLSIIPAFKPNVQVRTRAFVRRVVTDKAGRKATGVVYTDGLGREVEQPANLVMLCAFTPHNVRLLLLSKIGRPYNARTGAGVVGRNLSYQQMSSVPMLYEDRIFNEFMGAGGQSRVAEDFVGENFDHGGLGFVGGAQLKMNSNGRLPMSFLPTRAGAPRWGGAWKAEIAQWYTRAISVDTHASVASYRGNFLDLDPTYRDAFGDPLLRMTFDYPADHQAMMRFVTGKAGDIARAMNPTHLLPASLQTSWNVDRYNTTHLCGGAIMGRDPGSSVVNRYLQNWTVPNLFVFGASAFPQNAAQNPTGTVGALTYWALAKIKDTYLKRPGPLG